ncbi:Uncharacterised protein [Mycobacteroides abscessus subsp. abscessus]|nr:Uncharacterised protein [Mycobacteroides abscessus subsp. abscessus]
MRSPGIDGCARIARANVRCASRIDSGAFADRYERATTASSERVAVASVLSASSRSALAVGISALTAETRADAAASRRALAGGSVVRAALSLKLSAAVWESPCRSACAAERWRRSATSS